MLRLAKAVAIGLHVLEVLEHVVLENGSETFELKVRGREFAITIAAK